MNAATGSPYSGQSCARTRRSQVLGGINGQSIARRLTAAARAAAGRCSTEQDSLLPWHCLESLRTRSGWLYLAGMRGIHLWMVSAVLTVFALAGCQAAMSKPEPKPEPTPAPTPTPTPTELLGGTWRSVSPWHDDDERLVGTLVQTVTFTKSRWIAQHDVYVYDNGTPQEPWPNSDSGAWEASADSIKLTWYNRDDQEDDALPDAPEQFYVNYLWANDDRTQLLLQQWGGDEVRHEYFLYTKVVAPVSLDGTWTYGQPNDEFGGRLSIWSTVVNGQSLEWVAQYDPDEEPGGFFATITGTDMEEGFITMHPNDAPAGVVLRLAIAPGYSADSILVSPFWDEGVSHGEGEEEVWTSPNPKYPHGNYWMHMLRQ